jgi:hypothetical protein
MSNINVRINKQTSRGNKTTRRNKNRDRSILAGDGKVYSYNSVQPRQPDNSTRIFNCLLTVEDFTILSTSTTLVTNSSKQFQLSDCTGYTDLIAVFDQYRILSVECYITPIGSTLSANDGMYTTVIDYDDATSLTGTNALAYSNAVTSPGTACQYRHFIPHAAAALYGGSLFTSFGNLTQPWIDAGSVSVPHYGIKIMSTVTAAVRAFNLTTRMHLQFRNTR